MLQGIEILIFRDVDSLQLGAAPVLRAVPRAPCAGGRGSPAAQAQPDLIGFHGAVHMTTRRPQPYTSLHRKPRNCMSQRPGQSTRTTKKSRGLKPLVAPAARAAPAPPASLSFSLLRVVVLVALSLSLFLLMFGRLICLSSFLSPFLPSHFRCQP